MCMVVLLGVVKMRAGWVVTCGMSCLFVCRGCMTVVVMMSSPPDHVRYSQQTRYENKCRQKGLKYKCR